MRLAPLVRGPHGLEAVSWDDALDLAEQLLRGASGRIVTALSGSETTELAYGLATLMRRGLGAHSAVLHESTSAALDAFRASALYKAKLGQPFVDYLLKIKDAEVARFLSEVTDWEHREYFEMF